MLVVKERDMVVGVVLPVDVVGVPGAVMCSIYYTLLYINCNFIQTDEKIKLYAY